MHRLKDNRRAIGSARLAMMGTVVLLIVALGWCEVIGIRADETAGTDAAKIPQFEKDVHPLLKTYCWRCHGGEGYAAELDLRSLPLILKGGKNGKILEPSSAEKSLLYKKLAAKEMPPGNALKPTDAHLATIKAWIDGGAPARYTGGELTEDEDPPLTDSDRNWWAFRKPAHPEPPAVQHADRVRTPVDAFLLARLESKGLSFAPDADRTSLVRRAFLDLTGLPPGPDDIDRFLADPSPDAWEKLIDQLLESPHYGERWGRHWLDAAGYVDTVGSDNDATIIKPRDGAWLYRDYVVKAFNSDKPYDRFLLEQLAGDELVDWRQAGEFSPEMKELLVATGFLRPAADNTGENELNTADIRHQILYDTLQTVSTNVLGLTIHCAQCHSHKFDPIAQADFYRLMAVFAPAYNVQNWKKVDERFLADVSPIQKQEIDKRNAEIEKEIGEYNKQIAAIRDPVRQKLFEAKLAQIPEAIRQDTRTAIETPADKRNEVQKYLADKLGALVAVRPEDVAAALEPAAKSQIAEHESKIGSLNGGRRSYGKIQALWDVGPAPTAYLYRRGGYEFPGAPVKPGFPAVLVAHVPAPPIEPGAGGATSGHRTAFARWLTNAEHPLTPRVIVNRVWQHYFGRGIVVTPDNFGRSGAAPTHPELLDWLATEFVRSGWKFKSLHRLIVRSTAYRQASRVEPGDPATSGASIDPDNLLLWRMPLRRLESEIIRDSILAVSGKLDRATGGPAVPIKPLPDGMVVIETQNLPPGANPFRRSLYLVSRRNYQPTELSVFDQPLVATNCTRRTSAAVALQSLAMLNGTFATEQADQFAKRVIATAGGDELKRIDLAFKLALSRPPGSEELDKSRLLLARQFQRSLSQPNTKPAEADEQALAHLCHMLLNTNEFLYIP
ncbi:MAG: DUF1553 domain-containing protein [Planctomycetia bacterium]|nr:DUF1553 domain-containing protein [Planctomycetia bacterium]